MRTSILSGRLKSPLQSRPKESFIGFQVGLRLLLITCGADSAAPNLRGRRGACSDYVRLPAQGNHRHCARLLSGLRFRHCDPAAVLPAFLDEEERIALAEPAVKISELLAGELQRDGAADIRNLLHRRDEE